MIDELVRARTRGIVSAENLRLILLTRVADVPIEDLAAEQA
jgi:hypothetical protein